ncbi:MAG: hypothetical protein GXO89_10815 [Chlorobi bacterium]|nr:hypothetical protein [Chlorobiota bacterium]
MQRVNNNQDHSLPKHLVYHLSHKDINLGYFAYVQNRLNSLSSGDTLKANEDGLVNLNDEQIVKFSRTFQTVRDSLENRGYQLTESKIRFILFWKSNNENADEEKEIKIILPELYFEKEKTNNGNPKENILN